MKSASDLSDFLGPWGSLWLASGVWIGLISLSSWLVFSADFQRQIPPSLVLGVLRLQVSLVVFLPLHFLIAVIWSLRRRRPDTNARSCLFGFLICFVPLIEGLVIGYFCVYRLTTVPFG